MARGWQNKHGGDTEQAHTIVLSSIGIAGAEEGGQRANLNEHMLEQFAHGS